MLKRDDIDELLSGGLREDEIRARLLTLTPEKLDFDRFKRCMEQVKRHCSPDFAKLSGLGANAIDCSGTGGSGRPRFNTSTASAFILAAAEVRVAKFGNRAATSRSGSFDLLNKMGIPYNISPVVAARILDAAGLVFIFAPQAYPALATLSAVRASLGVATVFNFMGPLLNPVSPAYRVMGVADPIMQAFAAALLKETAGATASLVVRSVCGLDEICPRCGTDVREVRKGLLKEWKLKPTFKHGDCRKNERVHSPEENYEILLRIVEGKDSDSYEYELVCSNAGAGLHVAGKAATVEEGIEKARELLRERKVEEQMTKVKEAYAKHSS
jgi:anthranilate phosphoribosyltransferase